MTVEMQDYSRVAGGHGLPARRTRAPMGHAALDLIEHARLCLAEAASAGHAGDRFAAAHLAALRAA
ncbi:hypothetical protein DY240_09430, partial [Jiangella rhizosphaerae]